MKRVMPWIVVAVFVLTALPAVAAVPLTMSYQGVLTDNTGAIVPDGGHNFSFSIFNVPTGGSALWGPEVYSGLMVTRGGFSVVLGSVTPLTLPFDQQYYLDITVDGSPLSPRIMLASSPYSLAPWTTSGANVYRATGNVGIGTTTPGYLLDVGGTVTGAARIASPGPTSASLHLQDAGNETVLYSGYPSAGNFSIRQNSKTAMVITYQPLGPAMVGIGDIVPSANTLEVAGEASKTTAGSWLANSDARIKTSVNTVASALDKLDQVRLVNFHYTEEYRKTHPSIKDRQYCNVIAQEFQRVFPENVKGSGEKLPNGEEILQVDTYPLTIYSAAAIQELHRLLRTKDDEIAQLRQELAAQREFAGRIETRFSVLEKEVARTADRSTTAYSADHGK